MQDKASEIFKPIFNGRRPLQYVLKCFTQLDNLMFGLAKKY